jgi:polar amino acid transport system substrate-binding protein
MLRQRLAPLLWFVVVGLSWSLESHAQDRIRVPFSPLSPWKFVDENGFSGAYAELVRAIAREVKMPIEFIECPLKRCLRLMETGEANLIIGVKGSADRLVYIRFLETPYRTSSAKVFFVRKGLGKSVQKYSDLDGLKIGTKLGAKYFKRFDRDTTIRKVVSG